MCYPLRNIDRRKRASKLSFASPYPPKLIPEAMAMNFLESELASNLGSRSFLLVVVFTVGGRSGLNGMPATQLSCTMKWPVWSALPSKAMMVPVICYSILNWWFSLIWILPDPSSNMQTSSSLTNWPCSTLPRDKSIEVQASITPVMFCMTQGFFFCSLNRVPMIMVVVPGCKSNMLSTISTRWSHLSSAASLTAGLSYSNLLK